MGEYDKTPHNDKWVLKLSLGNYIYHFFIVSYLACIYGKMFNFTPDYLMMKVGTKLLFMDGILNVFLMVSM